MNSNDATLKSTANTATPTLAKYIFLDIVGFTHGRTECVQKNIVFIMKEMVRESIGHHKICEQKCICSWTGDGVCIALLDIEYPSDINILIALDVIKRIHNNNKNEDEANRFKVRVGLHSYKDYIIYDINAMRNMAGGGINRASRIMDIADGNQIIVSEEVFKDILNFNVNRYKHVFKKYKAKIKYDDIITVYQFVERGHHGLNIDIPPHVMGKYISKISRILQNYFIRSKQYMCTNLPG